MMNMYQGNMGMMPNMMMNQSMFQNLLIQGQQSLGPNGVLRVVQDLKNRVSKTDSIMTETKLFEQARPKSISYGKCSKISNTLKLRTPKIIAKNNF